MQQFEMDLDSVALLQQSCSGDTRWQQEVTAGGTSQFSDDEGDQVTFLLSLEANVSVCEADSWVCRQRRVVTLFHKRKKNFMKFVSSHQIQTYSFWENKVSHFSNTQTQRTSEMFHPGRSGGKWGETDGFKCSQFPAERKTVEAHWWRNCWASTKTATVHIHRRTDGVLSLTLLKND